MIDTTIARLVERDARRRQILQRVTVACPPARH